MELVPILIIAGGVAVAMMLAGAIGYAVRTEIKRRRSGDGHDFERVALHLVSEYGPVCRRCGETEGVHDAI